MTEHPVLAARLLKNMTLHLSDRVRGLTADLAQWVSRAAAGRATGPVVAGTAGAADDEVVN